MKQPKVSVITPVFNGEKYLSECIESVLNQSLGSVEIIVVDDGSTDGSWDVVTSFDDKVKPIHQENKGGCAARNHRATLSTGNYLMFLDADDLIAPDALEHLVGAFEGRVGIAACPWRRLKLQASEWVKFPSGLPVKPPEGDFFLDWLSGWYIPPCAILWSRETYDKTGGWDESLVANQDGVLIPRALLDGSQLHFATKGEAYYRHHGTARVSVSGNIGSVRAFKSRVRVLEKVVIRLEELGVLGRYRIAIGQAYHKLARNNFRTDVVIARVCQKRSKEFAGSKAVVGTWSHRMLCALFGLERKEYVANALGKWVFCNAKRKESEQLRGLKRSAK